MAPTNKIVQDIKSIIDLDLNVDWEFYDNAISDYLILNGYTLEDHFETDDLNAHCVSLQKIDGWLFDNARRGESRESEIKGANEILDQMQSDYVDNFKGGFF